VAETTSRRLTRASTQVTISFLLTGPAPFLLTRAVAWASQLAALTTFSTGFAFALVRRRVEVVVVVVVLLVRVVTVTTTPATVVTVVVVVVVVTTLPLVGGEEKPMVSWSNGPREVLEPPRFPSPREQVNK
jgi:hypothetical protein